MAGSSVLVCEKEMNLLEDIIKIFIWNICILECSLLSSLKNATNGAQHGAGKLKRIYWIEAKKSTSSEYDLSVYKILYMLYWVPV